MEQKCSQVMLNDATGKSDNINEYNLSKPYDISTRVYAGDSERCELDWNFNRKSLVIYLT